MNGKKILIIEDNLNDIKWYSNLFNYGREVNLLFYVKDKNYKKDKISEILELLDEDLSKKIKKIFVLNVSEEIVEFLKTEFFDFYIFDSLGGLSDSIIINSRLPKEKVAILSSTTSFRKLMKNKGCAVYKKADIDKLISELL
jgi:hypothetical protein